MGRSSNVARNTGAQCFEQLGACVGAIAYRGYADENRTFVEVTGSTERLTGHTPEDFTSGRIAFSNLMHAEDRAEVQGELELAMLERRGFQLCYRIVTARGEVRSVWEIGSVVDDEAGGSTLRGWILDVTSTPQTLSQARADASVARLAHDLNNLLSIITAGTEMLRATLDETSPAQAHIGQIREAANSSSRLTAQLGRLLGHALPSIGPTAINEVIARMELLLCGIVQDGVDLDLDPELEPVLVSPIHMERILLNLATNARDAMPQGGHLSISTRNAPISQGRELAGGWLIPGLYVKLVVTDVGRGISEQALSKVFKRGFSTKHSTGVGLAMVRQIVEDYGGAVDLRSQPGEGTTFEVYLPSGAVRGRGGVSGVVEK
jgi:PAS domain S-box-containing protein